MTDSVRIRITMDGKDHTRTLMDRGREVCEVSYVDTCIMISELANQLRAGKGYAYNLHWNDEDIEMSFVDAMHFVASSAGGLIFSS